MPEESQEVTGKQAEQTGQSGQPQAENGPTNSGNASRAASDKDALIAQLEAQLSQARQEAADNWNRFLRERAEMDNFRKRQERLMADRVLQQKKALLQKLLGVLDNVERALIFQDTLDKQGLQQALRMMQWQMSEVLRGEGLSPVPTIGETFNPYLHEAIEAVEDSDQPEGTIVEEVQKGYMMGEDTLRPARVKVSNGNNNKIVESQSQE